MITMNNLLFAIMYSKKEILDKTTHILEEKFGEIKTKSEEYDFNFTDYYEGEFGTNLKKIFIIFEKPIEKQDLITIRERTGEIEQELSKNNKRSVNIDPGHISRSELILATKKGKNWKEPLSNEIYAHKLLEFKDNEVISFYHTFTDYKLKQNIEFFKKFVSNLVD